MKKFSVTYHSGEPMVTIHLFVEVSVETEVWECQDMVKSLTLSDTEAQVHLQSAH
jgi:hypothetical protein